MIYISLGSNLGNRMHNLWVAIDLMRKRCLQNVKCSIVLETQALLPEGAPESWNIPYLNMIISGKTLLSPVDLLKVLKEIESEMGRPDQYDKWSPRLIDLDILLWENVEINIDKLTIPHLQLKNREFLQHLLFLMKANDWKIPFINSFTNTFILNPQLVGIVNVTQDSFSDGGKYHQVDKAVEQVHTLMNDGASMIEIGAQSTRPGGSIQSAELEYTKLEPILEALSSKLKNDIHVSIDTFQPYVIKKALSKYNISWINDVKGSLDAQTLEMIANQGCKLCCMHSLSIPPSIDKVIPSYQSVITVIKEWGEGLIERLLKLGFTLENIVLDPGIGFGKSAFHNIELLQSLSELKEMGTQVMIGHSRKSYLRTFSAVSAPLDRDLETIGASLAIQDKVDYLRVHNVRDHMRALVSYNVINT